MVSIQTVGLPWNKRQSFVDEHMRLAYEANLSQPRHVFPSRFFFVCKSSWAAESDVFIGQFALTFVGCSVRMVAFPCPPR